VKKKILFVTAGSFNRISPRAIRSKELILQFLKYGHEVTIIGRWFNIDDYDILKPYKSRLFLIPLKKSWNRLTFGSNILLIKFERIINNILNLLFEYPDIEYLFRVRKAIKKLNRKYDVLISIAQPFPIHWAIASVWKKYDIAEIWIADCGDPYFLNENIKYKKLFYFGILEYYFLSRVDYVTVPVEGARKCYFQKFHPKIIVIPQGVSIPKFERNDGKKDELNNTNLKFAYTGKISPYMDNFILFIEELGKIETAWEFYIFTYDIEIATKFTSHFQGEGKRVIINYTIERLQLLKLIRKVDFLVYFPYKYTSQLSFKLIDYSIVEIPILEFDSSLKSKEVMREFFGRQYLNKRSFLKLNDYKIEFIALDFLEILNSQR